MRGFFSSKILKCASCVAMYNWILVSQIIILIFSTSYPPHFPTPSLVFHLPPLSSISLPHSYSLPQLLTPNHHLICLLPLPLSPPLPSSLPSLPQTLWYGCTWGHCELGVWHESTVVWPQITNLGLSRVADTCLTAWCVCIRMRL